MAGGHDLQDLVASYRCRHGMLPFKLVQRRRLMREAHLIETTGLSIEAVAERAGTALRRPINREFGVTPGAMRA